MQDNSARKDGKPDDASRAADDEVNRRLVEHLKANALKTGRPVAANDLAPRPGFFSQASALIGLVGLMIVAYLYAKLVGNEA
jgi:hypothetical protein